MFLDMMVEAFGRPGAGFLYAITAVMAFGIAVVLERAWLFWFRWKVDEAALIARLDKGEFDDASRIAGENPAVRLLRAGAPRGDAEAAWDAMSAEAALVEEIVRRRVPYLATVGNLSTMLGLLGTVYGLILAFSALGEATAVERSTRLSEGMAAGMSATACGLLVGIPALGAHALLEGKASRILALCESVAARIASAKRA